MPSGYLCRAFVLTARYSILKAGFQRARERSRAVLIAPPLLLHTGIPYRVYDTTFGYQQRTVVNERSSSSLRRKSQLAFARVFVKSSISKRVGKCLEILRIYTYIRKSIETELWWTEWSMSSAQVSQQPPPPPLTASSSTSMPSQLLLSHIQHHSSSLHHQRNHQRSSPPAQDYDQGSNQSTLSPRSQITPSPPAASPTHSAATTGSPVSTYTPALSPGGAQDSSQTESGQSSQMPLLVAPMPVGTGPPHSHPPPPHPRLYVEGFPPPHHVPHPHPALGTYPLPRLPLMLPANPPGVPSGAAAPPPVSPQPAANHLSHSGATMATTTLLPPAQSQPKKSFCIDALLAKSQHQSGEPQPIIVDDRLAALHYARDQAELNHAFVTASNAAAAAQAAASAAGGISEQEALQRIRDSREYDSPSPDGMSRWVKKFGMSITIRKISEGVWKEKHINKAWKTYYEWSKNR